jgi:UDP-arabinose 4-epimerase
VNQKVLICGGAGYIGSHACKYLSEHGFIPVTYDNLSTGHRKSVKYGPFEFGDILDKTALTSAINTHNPVAIMHFAALAYVGESVVYPSKYYHNNVSGTLSVLDCMVKTGVKNLIFSSSCATFGIYHRPIKETFLQAPINPYGSSKLMCERMIKDFEKAYGIQSIILRYFNAAGADGEIGEDHNPETHLIPLAIQAALDPYRIMKVNGHDHLTHDGTCVRDYVHVNDLASAHFLALQRLLNGQGSNDFNLGTGIGYSIKGVICEVDRVSNSPMTVKYGSKRDGDPASLVSDNTKATSVLGWNPESSSLQAIIESAWKWHSKSYIPPN